jgi:Na+-driven multidrug efflux pump
MAAGLIVTVALDVALIPAYGAKGAAIASAIAYLTSTVALVWFYLSLARTERAGPWTAGTLNEADAQ